MSNVKNILYIVSVLDRVGPNRQQLNIFKNLDRKKFKLFVLTLTESSASSMETDYKNEKINVASLNLSRLAGVFCAKIKVENYISKYNIDLIHSFGYRADRISQKLTLPVLSSIRNYPHDEYISRYNLIFGYFLSISHIQIIKKMSNAVVCSYSLASEFEKRNNIKTSVIQNGVDTEVFINHNYSIKQKNSLKSKYGIPLGKTILLSSSVLIPRKNVDKIIKMYISNNLAGRDIALVIAGEGDQENYLKSISKGFNNIYFVGNVRNITNIYNISDYFISASSSEGLPNSVLEAMSCGLPCILSKIPMHFEIANNHKEFVEYFDINSKSKMYHSLIKIMRLNYSTISNECSAFINKNYSSKRMSKKYHKAYMKILEQ